MKFADLTINKSHQVIVTYIRDIRNSEKFLIPLNENNLQNISNMVMTKMKKKICEIRR